MTYAVWRWVVLGVLLAVVAAGIVWRKQGVADGKAARPAHTSPSVRQAPGALPVRARPASARADEGEWLMRPVTRAEVQAQFPFLPESQLRDGRQFIGLDATRVGALESGDDFAFSLPGLPSRQALVERTREEDGVRHIEGRLLSADDLRAERFTFTVSPDRSFVVGHVWMGDREYALQVRNGAGWWSRADVAVPAS